MGENSAIEWTHHTFNPWWGCTRVSPGCEHCYAETFARRFGVTWGVQAERRMFGEKHWREPLKWNDRAAARGERDRVFCASMADVFEDRPDLALARARLGRLIEQTRALDWLLLTKRPENMLRLGAELGWRAEWPINVWAGCTVEDQRRADQRIPELVKVPSAVRFLSCEPLLGPVELCGLAIDHVHWVIVGGESGPGARPMREEWALSLRDQCTRAGIAFHFKQWGGVLKKTTGRLLEGVTWDEVPS